ncbi:MAG: hypothetical protein AAB343_03195 [Patescibacteria group bacterium]
MKAKFYSTLTGILLTILAVVVAGVWLYFYQVRNAYTSLREHQVRMLQAEEVQEALIQMRGTVSDRDEDIKKIRTTLYRPGEKDLETHLAYLKLVEDLAAELQLTPFTMTRTSASSETRPFSTNFTFTTMGTYNNLLTFMAMLEQLPVFTVVEQASVSGGGTSMSLNVTIAVATTQ